MRFWLADGRSTRLKTIKKKRKKENENARIRADKVYETYLSVYPSKIFLTSGPRKLAISVDNPQNS